MSTTRSWSRSARRVGVGCLALTIGLSACSTSGGSVDKTGPTIASTAPSASRPATTRLATEAASASTTTPTPAPSTAAPPTAGGAPNTTAPPGPTSTTPTTSGAAASLGPVPTQLDSLEVGAEDVIDLVPDKGWGQIARAVQAMQTAWGEYRDAAAKADAALADRIDGALTALAKAAGGKDGQGAAQAANDVSAPLIELLARYDLGRPVQIGRLDVIGRQIVLDAGRRDVAAAATQVDAARAQWTAVKADVLAHKGDQVATDAEAVLEALDRALQAADAKSLTTKGTELLEIVDKMEGLY